MMAWRQVSWAAVVPVVMLVLFVAEMAVWEEEMQLEVDFDAACQGCRSPVSYEEVRSVSGGQKVTLHVHNYGDSTVQLYFVPLVKHQKAVLASTIAPHATKRLNAYSGHVFQIYGIPDTGKSIVVTDASDQSIVIESYALYFSTPNSVSSFPGCFDAMDNLALLDEAYLRYLDSNDIMISDATPSDVYHLGEFVLYLDLEPNVTMVEELWLLAADYGHAEAHASLGILYSTNLFGNSKKEETLPRLLCASMSGSPTAKQYLAYRLLLDGHNHDAMHAYRKLAIDALIHDEKRGNIHRIRRTAVLWGTVDWFADLDTSPYEQHFLHHDTHFAKTHGANSTYWLANRYFFGESGYEQNFATAIKLLQDGIRLKHPPSYSLLGFMHMKGIGMEVNVTRAIELFEFAANKEYAKAMNNLGYIYGFLQDPPNLKLATSWLTKAAARNNSDALISLGILQTNTTAKLDFFRRADYHGSFRALFEIGEVYRSLGNTTGALESYKGMSEKGPIGVGLEIGFRLYREQLNTGSFFTYLKLATLGFMNAQSNVAYLAATHHERWWLMQEESFLDEIALKFHRMAAGQGSHEDMRAYGELLLEQGDLSGVDYIKQANQSARALHRLATLHMLSNDLGVPHNLTKASELLQAALKMDPAAALPILMSRVLCGVLYLLSRLEYGSQPTVVEDAFLGILTVILVALVSSRVLRLS